MEDKYSITKSILANESTEFKDPEYFSTGDKAISHLSISNLHALSLLTATASSDFEIDKLDTNYTNDIYLNEGLIFRQWRNTENISSRVIEFDELTVVLECLIDKEDLIFEERVFKRSIFSHYELRLGKLFKLCMYERPGQVMMEIKDNPKLIQDEDFPKITFRDKFKNIKITNPD